MLPPGEFEPGKTRLTLFCVLNGTLYQTITQVKHAFPADRENSAHRLIRYTDRYSEQTRPRMLDTSALLLQIFLLTHAKRNQIEHDIHKQTKIHSRYATISTMFPSGSATVLS